jgi:hypothetical protein
MASDLMGSSNQLRLSRANLSGQLSRVSARSYAQSLCRISQAPTQSIKGGESVLSVAALSSIIEPKEFARPLSRHDIFLQGSIRNLKEFESEGLHLHWIGVGEWKPSKYRTKVATSIATASPKSPFR